MTKEQAELHANPPPGGDAKCPACYNVVEHFAAKNKPVCVCGEMLMHANDSIWMERWKDFAMSFIDPRHKQFSEPEINYWERFPLPYLMKVKQKLLAETLTLEQYHRDFVGSDGKPKTVTALHRYLDKHTSKAERREIVAGVDESSNQQHFAMGGAIE